jgi:hypothetical protein
MKNTVGIRLVRGYSKRTGVPVDGWVSDRLADRLECGNLIVRGSCGPTLLETSEADAYEYQQRSETTRFLVWSIVCELALILIIVCWP